MVDAPDHPQHHRKVVEGFDLDFYCRLVFELFVEGLDEFLAALESLY